MEDTARQVNFITSCNNPRRPVVNLSAVTCPPFIFPLAPRARPFNFSSIKSNSTCDLEHKNPLLASDQKHVREDDAQK